MAENLRFTRGCLQLTAVILPQVQCQLDKEGASSLVIDLVIKNSSNRVFLESVELGIALLEGGNTNIQGRKQQTFEKSVKK